MPATQPRPVTPTPEIPVFIWPTPNHEDRLFWVWRDGTLPKNDHTQWNYGDPYTEDPVKFPDHRLIHVSPQSDSRWSKWFYMAPRTYEDLYNFEFTQADIGGAKFDAVKRTYVVPREEFNPLLPLMGAVMPDVPTETFDGVYVLAERGQKRGSQELDSLFVTEERTYVRKVSLTNIKQDPENGIATDEVTTLYYRGEIPAGATSPIEDLVASKTDPYWIPDSNGYGNDAHQLSDNWFAVTRHQLRNLDIVQKSKVDSLLPSNFFCPDQTSSTTTSTINFEGTTPQAYAAPQSAQEVTRKGRFLETTTIRQSGSPKPNYGTTLDRRTGETFKDKIEIVPVSDVTESFVDTDGNIITFEPHDACFSRKITRKLVSTKVQTWTEAKNYEWPPVLTGISFKSWAKRDGTSAIFPRLSVKLASNEPQVATVRSWWQSAPASVVLPTPMVKTAIDYWCPLFNLKVPACLHGSFTVTVTTGTEDPVWAYDVDVLNVPATNLIDWPDSIKWVQVEPEDGGYRVKETTLSKPDSVVIVI